MNQPANASDRSTVGDVEHAPDRQFRLRVDERQLVTSYANAFRTHVTPEELMLDFGINTVQPSPGSNASGSSNGDGSQPDAEVILRTSNRIIMNYFTAKRLAITLSQAIRQHENLFGEIKLNASERTRGTKPD